MFLYKNQFLLIFSFLSIPIELWESTAAIFQQSAGYVRNCYQQIIDEIRSSSFPILTYVIG